MAPEGIKVYNPAFDVTDHELVTAIVTEDGVFNNFTVFSAETKTFI